MSSNTCNFDDASLLADGLAMMETAESDSIVVVEEEDEEEGSLEGVGKMQQTFDSMMCDTPSALEHGVCHPTTVPGIIETTESDFIVVFEEDKQERKRRKSDRKLQRQTPATMGRIQERKGVKQKRKKMSIWKVLRS
jgi:adenylate kinase